MSLLIRIDHFPSFEPKVSKAAPDRLIEGDPTYSSWPQDESRAKDGSVRTGVWQSTPGVNKSIKGEAMEFCHLLTGHVEITEEGGATHVFRAGDSFVMKPGFVGVWRTIETVRKVYVIVGG